MHQMFVELAGNYLKAMGERAYKYCIYRDECMKYLYRVGQHAFNYLVSQQEALPWLINRSQAAVIFTSKKAAVAEQLLNMGHFTLLYLNKRESAFESLVHRRRHLGMFCAADTSRGSIAFTACGCLSFHVRCTLPTAFPLLLSSPRINSFSIVL